MRRSGPILGPTGLAGIFAPFSIFREDVENLPLAPSQVNAEKLAKQLEITRPFINFKEFTDPVYIVPHEQPTVKVWLVETGGAEETLRPKTPFWEARQAECNAVPVPTVSLIPQKQIQANGTDATAEFWQPSRDRSWEFHRFGAFANTTGEGPKAGDYKANAVYFQQGVYRWNGICAPERGEQSASGLSAMATDMWLSELVAVARGALDFGHALKFALAETANGHVAPAKSNDTHNPNGPFAVPEGTWCRFPPSSRASEYFPGASQWLSRAIYETGRKYGFIVTDSSGTPSLRLCDCRTVFTPYCDATPNVLHGATFSGLESYLYSNVTAQAKAGRIDPSLRIFEGQLNGATGVMTGMPWHTLELLAPREG
jgi:hypothetical protein